jgi:hypothetical protein
MLPQQVWVGQRPAQAKAGRPPRVPVPIGRAFLPVLMLLQPPAEVRALMALLASPALVMRLRRRLALLLVRLAA